MTVYARSDVMSVSLSKDHGGCGATHSRPVTHGAPSKEWALECVACEGHLRYDPHWATNSSEVPETPDEIRIREDQDKKGVHTREVNMENAVASLAATADGFQKLMAMMLASNPEMAANMSKMLGAVAAAPVVGQSTIDEAADDATPNTMKLADLRALAKERGLNATGTREQLLARLAGEG